MKNKQHLPMYGVGPVYVAVILALTVAGIVLTAVGYIPTVRIEFIRIPLRIIGILMIVLGAWFWWSAVFRSRVDDHIKDNVPGGGKRISESPHPVLSSGYYR